MTSIILFLIFFLHTAKPDRELRLIKTIPTNVPSKVSLDRAGNIYLVDQTGHLFLYNEKGELQLDYSPPRPAEVTLLEAWQGLRIFLFFRDLQEYTFLNRFLTNQQGNYGFSNTGFVEMAAPSYDNNIWLIDQADFSIKKYGIFQQEILSSTPFDLLLDPDLYEITFIKEYQNKVFVGDRNTGILLFDNFGNFIRKYDYPGLDEFNFYDNYIYFLDGETIVQIDLYDDTRQAITLPGSTNFLHVLIFGDNYYLFDNTGMQIYKPDG